MADLTPEALTRAGREAAAGYSLRPLMARSRHAAGTFSGNEPGASLEFHEYRPYLPGDDLRRVDWGVYGRSDVLVVRQYRVELSPFVEIHLDVSRSMGLYPGKSAAALFLAAFLAGVTERAEGVPVLVTGEDRHRQDAVDRALNSCPFTASEDLGTVRSGGAGRGRPVRVLLSDFLFETAAAVLRRLESGAELTVPVVFLADAERHPRIRGAARLVDAETEARGADMHITPRVVEGYERRLNAHLAELEQVSRRHLGMLVRLDVENRYKTVDEVARAAVDACLKGGIVEPS